MIIWDNGTRVYADHQRWPDAIEFGTGKVVDYIVRDRGKSLTYFVQLDAGGTAQWAEAITCKARRQTG